MLDPINANTFQSIATQAWYLIPLLTFIASLTGSVHCLVMCGGFSSVVKGDRYSLSFYHLGRLFTYFLLGSLAGLTGQLLLQSSFKWVSTFVTLVLATSFIYLGIQVWRRGTYTIQLPGSFVRFIQKRIGGSIRSEHPLAGFFVGFFSGFLPCGWLYTFILAAITTQNFLIGGVMLFFFWMGTVPILTLSRGILKTGFKRLSPMYKNIGATCLILAGLTTIAVKFTSDFCFH